MLKSKSRIAALVCAGSLAAGCSSARFRNNVSRIDDAQSRPVEIVRRSNRHRDIEEIVAPDVRVEEDDAVIAAANFEDIQDGAEAAPDEAAPPAADLVEPIDPDPPEGEVSSGLNLTTLEAWAMERNPTIRQASAAAYKATGIHHQVGLCPNPTIGYTGEEIGNEGDAGQQGAYVSQMFITGDKLDVNRQVLNQDVQAMLWEVETQRYRVRTDVQRRYFQVLAAQRRLAISHKFHEVAEQGVDIAQKRFDAQEGARPDILQAEIQRTEVDLLIRRAEFDLDGSRQALAAVIGVEVLPEQTLTGELKSIPVERDPATTYQTLVGSSPELRAAYSRQHRARLNIGRQEIQAIPNPTVQVGGGRDTSTGSGVAGLQVSMAIPAWNKNEGNIEAANADYCRAVQDVRRLELGLKSRLALALKDYNSARVTVEQYQDEILPRAQEALDLSELAYQAGEFDFIRVLTARRQYFEANLQYIDALAEYSVADAVIEGLLLSGGLDETMDFDRDDTLRDRAMNNM